MELSNILRSYQMLQIASISNLNEDNSHICAKISINIVNVLMSGSFSHSEYGGTHLKCQL